MTKRLDLTGQRFGRLLVVEDLGIYAKNGMGKRKHWFKCICDCGNELVTTLDSLKSGSTKSCGCLAKEIHYKIFKKFNEYEVFNDIVFVKFTNCDEYFICDLDDWEELKCYAWCKRHDDGYAVSMINGKLTRFHKLVLECEDCYEVDHIRQVKNAVCDNRKSNLRKATSSENSMNTRAHCDSSTGIKGVSFVKARNKYMAQIYVDGKNLNLGLYNDISEAARARREAELKYFGDFALKC